MELTDKMLKRLEDGREYRNMKMEARAAGEDEEEKMIVEGYATTFNQPYILGEGRYYKLLEQIAPEAFNECDMSDVILQYDHEGRVFARTRNNTMQLEIDEKGLKIIADLGGTDIGRSLYQEIKGGYTDRMSFCFVISEQKREEIYDEEKDFTTIIRTITKIKKLYDVSAVSIPANDMTSISARRFADGAIRELDAERHLRANKKKLMLKIKLMEVGKNAN